MRWHALCILGVEFDENFYVPASMHYAEAIREHTWNDIINYDFNKEHPIFTKLIYAISVLVTDSVGSFEKALMACRVVSTIFTVGNVILISLINPISGFFFAVNSWSIMYSSVAYLDSPSTFFASIAVITFYQSKSKSNKYMIISAISAGLGLASKYYIIPVPIALLLLVIWNGRKQQFTRESLKTLVSYILVLILTFFLSNPILWTKTTERLYFSLNYWKESTHDKAVMEANFPIHQQYIWLSMSNPLHTQFLFHWDSYVLFLGLLGLPFLFMRNRVYGLWYLANALFILLWPVKFPQYTLIFIPPLTLGVGELIRFQIKAINKLSSKTNLHRNLSHWILSKKSKIVITVLVFIIIILGLSIILPQIPTPPKSLMDYVVESDTHGIIRSDYIFLSMHGDYVVLRGPLKIQINYIAHDWNYSKVETLNKCYVEIKEGETMRFELNELYVTPINGLAGRDIEIKPKTD